MFDLKNADVKKYLLKGNFGLEKESLRITPKGHLAQTVHPFPGEKHIVRDFSENQTEINTGVSDSAEGAIQELEFYTRMMLKLLNELDPKEYLWPNSNPPYIANENDIPIAVYGEDEIDKAVYREYLSVRYGRYKMAFSGIHVNYSFSDELLEAGFNSSAETDFRTYKDRVYLKLASNLAAYGWIVTAITAASPDLDGSYLEEGREGRTSFLGMASVRCSELGYWNHFVPVFSYSSLPAYIKSIQRYVDKGFIAFPSELYYPIRLKPRGENNLANLEEFGVDHIELRNVDLNPMVYAGLDIRDLKFIQYLLAWLMCLPKMELSEADQVQIGQNFKNAARYDLRTVNIVMNNGEYCSADKAVIKVIGQMKEFFLKLYSGDQLKEILNILDFQQDKFVHPHNRYAYKCHKMFGENFFEKNLEIAKKKQEI